MDRINRIKQRKKELGLTFEELARLSGIPLRTLENIYHGITKHPRVDTMQAIERALGLDAPAPEASKEAQQLFTLLNELTEDELVELSSFVDFIISKRK
jgi:transcriptional regulator with XRE-family HTH domain